MVDSSVVAAIVFWEPERDLALSLTRDVELCAPALLQYELASVARTKIRSYPELERTMLSNLIDGLALQIEVREVSYVAVVQLALQRDLSTYDASYLYLARQLGMRLVTFDRRLRAAAEGMPDDLP